jgi:hypothetical protein
MVSAGKLPQVPKLRPFFSGPGIAKFPVQLFSHRAPGGLGIRPFRARFGCLGGVLDTLRFPRPWSAGYFLHFRIFDIRLPVLERGVALGTPGWTWGRF